jgi:hypothetical protein
MKHCNNCNLDYEDKFRFCRKCGAPLVDIPVQNDTNVVEEKPDKNRTLLFALIAIIVIALGYYFVEVANPRLEKGQLYAIVKIDDRWGVINQKGKYIIPPKFSMIGRKFSESKLRALDPQTHKWGYIDQMNQFVIKPQFDTAWDFQEGLAGVREKGKIGFIDKTGKYVIKPQFDSISSFNQGVAVVSSNNKYGLIDKTGKYILKPYLDDITYFREGLASAKLNNQYGYIDTTGKFVIKPQFDEAYSFEDGIARVKIGEKCKFIKKNGDEAFKIPDDAVINNFHDGLLVLQKMNDHKRIVLNTAGDMVLQLSSNIGFTSWSEGLAVVSIFDGKPKQNYGYIDLNGHFVVKPKFTNAWDFHNGFAIVKSDDEKYGFIDRKGNYVVKPIYDKLYDFSNGFAAIVKDNKVGYVNTEGKIVIEPKYFC